jgi:pilus assembly protein Flp/PilA
MPRHRRTPASDDGASAVEYGLLVAAVAAVIVLMIFALGRATGAAFDDTCDALENNSNAAVGQVTDCPP